MRTKLSKKDKQALDLLGEIHSTLKKDSLDIVYFESEGSLHLCADWGEAGVEYCACPLTSKVSAPLGDFSRNDRESICPNCFNFWSTKVIYGDWTTVREFSRSVESIRAASSTKEFYLKLEEFMDLWCHSSVYYQNWALKTLEDLRKHPLYIRGRDQKIQALFLELSTKAQQEGLLPPDFNLDSDAANAPWFAFVIEDKQSHIMESLAASEHLGDQELRLITHFALNENLYCGPSALGELSDFIFKPTLSLSQHEVSLNMDEVNQALYLAQVSGGTLTLKDAFKTVVALR